MIDTEGNTILSAEVLENSFIFFKNSKGDFNFADFLDEGMVARVRFFYLGFDCL